MMSAKKSVTEFLFTLILVCLRWEGIVCEWRNVRSMIGILSEVLSGISRIGGGTVVVTVDAFGSSFIMLFIFPGDFAFSSMWLWYIVDLEGI